MGGWGKVAVKSEGLHALPSPLLPSPSWYIPNVYIYASAREHWRAQETDSAEDATRREEKKPMVRSDGQILLMGHLRTRQVAYALSQHETEHTGRSLSKSDPSSISKVIRPGNGCSAHIPYTFATHLGGRACFWHMLQVSGSTSPQCVEIGHIFVWFRTMAPGSMEM